MLPPEYFRWFSALDAAYGSADGEDLTVEGEGFGRQTFGLLARMEQLGCDITSFRYRRYVETRSRSQRWRGFRGKLWAEGSFAVPLDYVSCLLTIFSTILVGRRCWEGWVLAAVNSVIICIIGLRTQQFGFIPANVFCLVLYGVNLRTWRKVDS